MVQTAKETVLITIRRQDPEVDNNKPYYQDYNVEVEDWFTVLDALIKIREQMDGLFLFGVLAELQYVDLVQ